MSSKVEDKAAVLDRILTHDSLDDTKPEAQRLRQLALAAIEKHEAAEHGGGICWRTRIGVIAYLCHSVGVDITREDAHGVALLGILLTQLDEYNQNCPEYRRQLAGGLPHYHTLSS